MIIPYESILFYYIIVGFYHILTIIIDSHGMILYNSEILSWMTNDDYIFLHPTTIGAKNWGPVRGTVT